MSDLPLVAEPLPEAYGPDAEVGEPADDAGGFPLPDGIHPVGDEPGRKRWGTGLCDCLSQCMPSCLMAWFCPCFVFAKIRSQTGINEPNYCGIEDDYWKNCMFTAIPGVLQIVAQIAAVIPPAGFLFAAIAQAFTIVNCCLLWGTRTHFRARYGIRDPTSCCCFEDELEGSCGNPDCCTVCFCGPCALAQLERTEIRHQGCCNGDECVNAFSAPL